MSEADGFPEFDAWIRRAKRWGIRLLVAVVSVVAVLAIFGVVVNVVTQRLWYRSVQAGGVYSTILRTEILLFVVFGLIAAVIGGLAAWAIQRTWPLVPREEDLDEVPSWRRWVSAHPKLTRRAVQALAIVVPGLILGSRAAGQWQTWQLWRHASSWGVTDPTFHRDVSYYVEVYPMHRMVVSLLASTVNWALLITVVAAVLHGSLRLRGPGRITRALTVQLSAIGVLYLLVKAAGYWLDRQALVVSRTGSVTGGSYTDLHAVAPGKIVLLVVFVLVAVLLAVNIVVGRVRLLALGVVTCLVFSVLAGSAWPALVLKFREQPSAATLTIDEIKRNQAATIDAFGLQDAIKTTPFGSDDDALHGTALTDQAAQNAQIRILDPNQLSPTFNVKQQLQAYYGFKPTLDIDRYDLDSASGSGSAATTSRDVAIAVRELKVGGVSLGSWANKHVVYTHGYGVVAAPTDSLDGKSSLPEFLDGGIPPEQQIPVTHPEVYFGQSSPAYSIVGQPAGSTTDAEFDHPGTDGVPAAKTTYAGGGGVAIGSTFDQLMFAAKLHDPNILFSGSVNSGSRILTVRDPRARVAAVAPWLTLDGNVYPAVVDGNITWIVDAYTTSKTYPSSQLVNLNQATSSTLTSSGSEVAQPSQSVNYMQNSVKATVDAYTGAVTLYEWQQDTHPDPLLKTWESVFPDLVRPQSEMSQSLIDHVRYPMDLFDVQRQLVTKYHVTDPADFYAGNDFWSVPSDPTVAANQQLNSGSAASSTKGPTLPSTYMSISPDGASAAEYSLSSPLVTLNNQDLAGFLTVNSDASGGDYGKFTLLQLPVGASIGSPSQIQNDIESNTKISEALTLQRGGNSKVVLGNLLTLPLGGRILHVEPIYTQATGGTSFPILRHVVAIYGNGDPAFTTSLPAALRQALKSGDDDPGSGSTQ